jgi:hypothetical protein
VVPGSTLRVSPFTTISNDPGIARKLARAKRAAHPGSDEDHDICAVVKHEIVKHPSQVSEGRSAATYWN